MNRSLILDELDRTGQLLGLTRAQAIAIASTGLVAVRPEANGQWRVLPLGKVGAARVGDVQIQVLPKEKVDLTRLLFLLGYAADPGFRPEDVSGTEEPDLWPALAESLARLAERATGQGVLQGYRSAEESLQTVRGRIRIGDQVARHPGFMLPIEVTYDEFTTDIPENQILRTAIRTVLCVPRLPRSSAARLSHIDGRLAEVAVLRRGAQLPSWRATRLNQHYQSALRLAEIILANTSAEPGVGSIQVAAFVVDMARVFEDFVGTALTETLRAYPGVTGLQYAEYLDRTDAVDKSRISIFVDIVHSVRGKPRLVFDAKYKAASAGETYPNADHYQMLAYCTALGVRTAWLVYAGKGKLRIRKIRNTEIEIVEFPIDVGQNPANLLGQIDLLASLAWGRNQTMLLDTGSDITASKLIRASKIHGQPDIQWAETD